MDCPRCGEATDPGAAFCGNCGQALDPAAAVVPASSLSPRPAAVPAYAVANPQAERAETKAMVALILSILALPAAILPLLGWVLAAASITIGLSSRKHAPRRMMSNVALGFASFAVLLAGGTFTYNIVQYDKDDATARQPAFNSTQNTDSTARIVTGSVVDTPCYTLDVGGLEHIQHVASSCNAQAFNADTMLASTNALNIEAVSQNKVTESNLADTGREVADNYLRSSLPNLVITAQGLGSFAGSPAYIISGRNGATVTIELALVVRKVSHGENVFVLAHAINDAQADLSQFETSWEWK